MEPHGYNRSLSGFALFDVKNAKKTQLFEHFLPCKLRPELASQEPIRRIL
jgi:hypothetical protein